MKIYSIVTTKTYSSDSAHPRVNVSYSCTDKNLCYKMLKKKAVAYLRENEKLEDFKQKNSYYIPNRKKDFSISLCVKESDVAFNSNHDDEMSDFISGLYDRIAQLMIMCGEKEEKDDELRFRIPIDSDILEKATGYNEIRTDTAFTDYDYVVMNIIYDSYDNGKGENGNILLDVVSGSLMHTMDIAVLNDNMVCALADYLEMYYETTKKQ